MTWIQCFYDFERCFHGKCLVLRVVTELYEAIFIIVIFRFIYSQLTMQWLVQADFILGIHIFRFRYRQQKGFHSFCIQFFIPLDDIILFIQFDRSAVRAHHVCHVRFHSNSCSNSSVLFQCVHADESEIIAISTGFVRADSPGMPCGPSAGLYHLTQQKKMKKRRKQITTHCWYC